MLKHSVDAAEGTLFVPVASLQAASSVDAFEQQVYYGIAQALIANVDAFRQALVNGPNVARLNHWLNDATFRQGSGALMGFAAGGGAVPNESQGYAASGFPEAVRAELASCFPGTGAGAMVCVVDNLELLQTVGEARSTLEALRDRVFRLPGTRWVLLSPQPQTVRQHYDHFTMTPSDSTHCPTNPWSASRSPNTRGCQPTRRLSEQCRYSRSPHTPGSPPLDRRRLLRRTPFPAHSGRLTLTRQAEFETPGHANWDWAVSTSYVDPPS